MALIDVKLPSVCVGESSGFLPLRHSFEVMERIEERWECASEEFGMFVCGKQRSG